MLTIGVGSVVLVLGGLCVLVAFAIIAGIVSARVFFAASRDHADPPSLGGRPD